MGSNSPATGRPGLGSHVSIWLMPPPFQKRMTCLAVAFFVSPARASICAMGMPSSVALETPSIRRRVI